MKRKWSNDVSKPGYGTRGRGDGRRRTKGWKRDGRKGTGREGPLSSEKQNSHVRNLLTHGR